MPDDAVKVALADIVAGVPPSEGMSRGVRATLRHVTTRLDNLADRAAPKGKRTTKNQRAAYDALVAAADEFHALMRAVDHDALAAAVRTALVARLAAEEGDARDA